jgi:hypothetical protein
VNDCGSVRWKDGPDLLRVTSIDDRKIFSEPGRGDTVEAPLASRDAQTSVSWADAQASR